MKKNFLVAMTLALCLGSSMTALAAPEVMSDGNVFDAEYYAQNNPDVVNVLGTDKDLLYQHYQSFGKMEGRLACAVETEKAQVTQEESPIKCDLSTDSQFPFDYLNPFCGVPYIEKKKPNFNMETCESIPKVYRTFKRGDYSKEPLYIELAKQVLIQKAVYDQNPSLDTQRLICRDYVGDIQINTMDTEYIVNVVGNLVYDFRKMFPNVNRGAVTDPTVDASDMDGCTLNKIMLMRLETGQIKEPYLQKYIEICVK